MMTRIFLLSLLSLALSACVTESVQTKTSSKKVYVAQMKQGPLRFEVQGAETIMTSQLKSLSPGFYQVALANGNVCPAANTVVEGNLFYEQSDAFYVPDTKPQTIIQQFNRFLPNGTAMLLKKDDNTQTLVGCAKLPVSKK